MLNTYTEVKDNNISLKNAIFPIQTVNIPEKLTEEVKHFFDTNLKEEMTWVKMVASHVTNEETTETTDEIQSVSYTKSF